MNGYSPEINVTPLVDVVLVLLIIFMLVVPALATGYRVEVPGETAASPERSEPLEQVVLTIDSSDCALLAPHPGAGLPADCAVRLGDERIQVRDLAQRIDATFASRAADDRVLFLAAESTLNYEGVLRILDLAQSRVAGLRIGFVREE